MKAQRPLAFALKRAGKNVSESIYWFGGLLPPQPSPLLVPPAAASTVDVYRRHPEGSIQRWQCNVISRPTIPERITLHCTVAVGCDGNIRKGLLQH